MRSLCLGLTGTFLTGVLVCLAPGCGGGASELENPPDVTKKVDPVTDMPGYKEMQDQLKTKGKAKKR